jgi:hypothetical protein
MAALNPQLTALKPRWWYLIVAEHRYFRVGQVSTKNLQVVLHFYFTVVLTGKAGKLTETKI